MSLENLDYNTQRQTLVLSEYGRTIQDMVQYIKTLPDREVRTRMAHTIVTVMGILNPYVKDMSDYKQKLWDHLYIIAGYDLDVDSPYPVPQPSELASKPERIPYPNSHIRFRFYGRNLQNMVNSAAEMKDGTEKTALLNLIASFMRNSSRNWNNENLTAEVIADHLQIMSQGKLQTSADALTITYENAPRNNFKKGNFNRNHFKNKKNNRNFRKK